MFYIHFNNSMKVKMERKIRQLEDDMKEYWGFYLLKDSVYKSVQPLVTSSLSDLFTSLENLL